VAGRACPTWRASLLPYPLPLQDSAAFTALPTALSCLHCLYLPVSTLPGKKKNAGCATRFAVFFNRYPLRSSFASIPHAAPCGILRCCPPCVLAPAGFCLTAFCVFCLLCMSMSGCCVVSLLEPLKCTASSIRDADATGELRMTWPVTHSFFLHHACARLRLQLPTFHAARAALTSFLPAGRYSACAWLRLPAFFKNGLPGVAGVRCRCWRQGRCTSCCAVRCWLYKTRLPGRTVGLGRGMAWWRDMAALLCCACGSALKTPPLSSAQTTVA